MARITLQQRLIEALIATGRAAAAPTLAYNLVNFMRTLALPQEVKHWSLTTLRDTLVRSGANGAPRPVRDVPASRSGRSKDAVR
jgi:hypothetical protein